MAQSHIPEQADRLNAREDRDKETARRYIRSVAAIDDGAFIDNPAMHRTDDRRPLSQESHQADLHRLDAGLLTKKFAEKGISFSMVIPIADENNDILVEQYFKIIKAADAAILDWQLSPALEGNKSLLCKKLVKKIIVTEKGSRPRLILIYTAEQVNEHLSEELQNAIKEDDDDLVMTELNENFGFMFNRLKVIFFSKSVANSGQGMGPGSFLSPDNLPDELINQFSSLVTGLLPKVAFNAVAAIREKIDCLLSIFNKDLDAAFVHHLILAGAKANSASFLADLFKDELCTIIVDDDEFLKSVSGQELIEWYNATDNFMKAAKLDSVVFKGLLELGYESYLDTKKNNKEFDKSPLTQNEREELMKKIIHNTHSSLQNFSHVAALKREAFNHNRSYWVASPRLTYGTLIKRDKTPDGKPSDDYYLCIIPKCDSVRLSAETRTRFPFLRLKLSDDATKKRHLCFKASEDCTGKIATFQFSKAWNKIDFFEFTPGENSTEIRALNTNGSSIYCFTGTNPDTPDKPIQFTWIADVKDATMSNILQQIFQNITRMGFDDFEWLRRGR